MGYEILSKIKDSKKDGNPESTNSKGDNINKSKED